MKTAGIPGYFTNHSLRATTTTCLYDTQVDEATIMEQLAISPQMMSECTRGQVKS